MGRFVHLESQIKNSDLANNRLQGTASTDALSAPEPEHWVSQLEQEYRQGLKIWQDERIKKACEFVFDNSQDIESGGFPMHRNKKTGGGRHSEVLPCLTGNMVWSLMRLGYADDPRVQRGINWITRYQRFDDAVTNPPARWPYDKAEPCWGINPDRQSPLRTR